MSQKRDTDYLAVSTRIHAMENRMLTRERMERMIGKRAHERAVCRYDCVNMDAFALARRLRQAYPQEQILVLNLANPFEPGGGVRRGARAQEEDLCLNSSLLLSLESKAAHRYYAYHCGLRSPFSSDAMILTPAACAPSMISLTTSSPVKISTSMKST